MIFFAYRERETGICQYVEDRIGVQSVCAPGSWITIGKSWSGGESQLFYDDVDTFLSPEQYDEFCEQGLTAEVLQALSSPEALDFAEQIFAEEFNAMMEQHRLSAEDVQFIVDNYPNGSYKDREIIAAVYDDWREIAEEKAWSWGMVGEDDRYFNYDAFAEDLQDDELFLELPCGKIAYFQD